MKKDIKLIPKDERPREKALKRGVDNLSTLELLQIVIGSGTKNSSVIDIAYDLLFLLNEVNYYSLSLKDLLKIDGISSIKAIEILTIIELSKRFNSTMLDSSESMNSPSIVYEKYKGMLLNYTQERMLILYLNGKNKVIKEEILFVGGVDFVNVDPNLILHNAIKYNAKGFICLHNHPSGDVTPSKNDVSTTKQIKEMSLLLRVKLLDHIIVGNGFYSFKENDIL